jgi:hypothetical protein
MEKNMQIVMSFHFLVGLAVYISMAVIWVEILMGVIT